MKKNPFILDSLGIAIVFVCTSIFIIPIGMGYLTMGDTMIMLFASISSPLHAFLIGSIGSFLADLMLAPSYAIFTFFIKGIEAVLISYLCMHSKKSHFLAFFIGGISVLIGYACTDVLLTQQISAALPSIGMNSFQIGACFLVATYLFPFLKRFYSSFKD